VEILGDIDDFDSSIEAGFQGNDENNPGLGVIGVKRTSTL